MLEKKEDNSVSNTETQTQQKNSYSEATKKNSEQNKTDASKIDFVKWFSELDKNSGNIAGGKGANLAEIYNLKVPVPPGFVVTAQAYDYFIEKAGLKNQIKELLDKIDYENTKQLDETTQKIREHILKADFPKQMEEEIIDSYGSLDVDHFDQKSGAIDILKSSKEPIFVAVRSSATAEDLADASFAGQQDSFVNIKGQTELIKHIKKAFASLFTSRATYYRNKKGFGHEKVSLAVVVQKMVDSDKSGVVFSKDPSYKNNNTIIEAVFGLGEGIVSGKITPDKYIISKELEILDKKIADKKIAITRDSSGAKTTVKLRPEKSSAQVLKDYEIRKLAEIALKLEEHYQKPQDIEFAIEGENIFIVQTRPITTLQTRMDVGEAIKELKGEVVLTGLPASPGIASGKVKIVESLKDLQKVNKGDILVTDMTNPDMVVTMQKSSAIITNEGGMTAHAAIVSREMGIPAVVGTQEATSKLKEGEVITVDGFSGKIYKGKVSETIQKPIEPVSAETKTEIKVIVDLPSFAERAAKSRIRGVGLTRIEGIIAESGKHPNYFLRQEKIQDYEEVIYKGIEQISKYFGELWIRTSDIRSDEFEHLEGASQEKEANPMLGFHGIRYSLKNPEIFKAELKALKKISENNKKIGLLLPQIISVEEVQKVKEILKEISFNNVKVGVMIETPASVQIIRSLCEEGIDFISFGTNDLTQYILAVDRGNEQVQELYDEMHPAVLQQLEYVLRTCKKHNVQTSICGQAGSKKPMVKFLVERGINSISVNADVAKEISDYVAEIEKSLEKPEDQPRQYQPEKKEDAHREIEQTQTKSQEPTQQEISNSLLKESSEIEPKQPVIPQEEAEQTPAETQEPATKTQEEPQQEQPKFKTQESNSEISPNKAQESSINAQPAQDAQESVLTEENTNQSEQNNQIKEQEEEFLETPEALVREPVEEEPEFKTQEELQDYEEIPESPTKEKSEEVLDIF